MCWKYTYLLLRSRTPCIFSTPVLVTFEALALISATRDPMNDNQRRGNQYAVNLQDGMEANLGASPEEIREYGGRKQMTNQIFNYSGFENRTCERLRK